MKLSIRFFGKYLSLILVLFINGCITDHDDDIKAYYTKIDSGQEFERISRTGTYADIIVKLKKGRFVFWRGSSYLPYWETDKGKWFVDELFSRKGNGPSQRPDKVNTYSRVIIAEHDKDKIVICWRYLPQFSGTNPHSNVDPTRFVEEYFTIQQDGKVNRIAGKGTQKVDNWKDPLNKTVETFRLTRDGINNYILHQPDNSAKKEKKINGNPIHKRFVVEPIRHWSFDESFGDTTLEKVTGKKCAITGDKSLWKSGISGTALQFDGYKSEITLPSYQAPGISDAITLEAWVAIGAYPWNWTPIIQQCDDVTEGVQNNNENDVGYFIGINGLGYPGFKIRVGNKWEELVSEKLLERRQWYHIAGTYDKQTGEMNLFIDGKNHGKKKITSANIILSDNNIRIGKGKPRKPIRPVRANTFEASYSFDGLIDEISIYDVALSSSQIRQSYNRFKPVYTIIENPDMDKRVLPPGENRRRFGAYYTNLKFYESWDNMWRFGDYPDVVVEFDSSPVKFVFWRGTGYIPMLFNNYCSVAYLKGLRQFKIN